MSANVCSVYHLQDKQFRNEQDFKTWQMAELGRFCKVVFEIENEEKEPGFPDVLAIDNDDVARFYEFKVARKSGNFKFESTQPRFFNRHSYLKIYVMVWDAERHDMYCIPATIAANAVLAAGKLTLNVRKF